MLCIGIPLRLLSFSTLGYNFTFGLAKLDGLVTSGIYTYWRVAPVVHEVSDHGSGVYGADVLGGWGYGLLMLPR